MHPTAPVLAFLLLALAPVPPAEYPCPLAGLVTVGHRDGRHLLIDLESCGSLAVTGDPHAAEAFVRAVVLELGAGDEVADAYVTTVGLDIDGVEQLGRVHSADSATAIAPTEPVLKSLSETDVQLAPPSNVFQTPPPVDPW